MIYNMFIFWEFEIFSNFRKWPKFRLFRENCSWNRETKIFSQYFWWFGLSDKFSFRRYIICWGNLSLSKIIGGGGGGGGGHPAPPHPFILQICVLSMVHNHLDMLELSFRIMYHYLLKNQLHGIHSKWVEKNFIFSHILQLGCNVILMVLMVYALLYMLIYCSFPLCGVLVLVAGTAFLGGSGCWLPFQLCGLLFCLRQPIYFAGGNVVCIIGCWLVPAIFPLLLVGLSFCCLTRCFAGGEILMFLDGFFTAPACLITDFYLPFQVKYYNVCFQILSSFCCPLPEGWTGW